MVQDSEKYKTRTSGNSLLLGIEPSRDIDIVMSAAASRVSGQLFGEDAMLRRALGVYARNPGMFGVQWQTNAALANAKAGLLFNDSTTNGMRVAPPDKYNISINPELYKIDIDRTPHLAVVILDPSNLGVLSDAERDELLHDVMTAKAFAFSSSSVDGSSQTCEYLGPNLKKVLERCLVTHGTIEPENNETWAKPYDIIAVCKALFTLLSGHDNSGEMRQGAVRVPSEDGREIIVACSGFRSEVDELIARTIAGKIVDQPLDVAGYTKAITDAFTSGNYEEARRLSDILGSVISKLAKGAGRVSLSHEIDDNNYPEIRPGTAEWLLLLERAKVSNIVINPNDIVAYFGGKPDIKTSNVNSQSSRLWSRLTSLSLLINEDNAKLAATNKNLEQMYGGIRFRQNATTRINHADEAIDLSLAGLMEYCEAVLKHFNPDRSAHINSLAVAHGISAEARKLLEELLYLVGPATINNLLGVINKKAEEVMGDSHAQK